MKYGTLQAITISALLATPAFADPARVSNYKTQLASVRPPELAGETARIISNKGDAADAVTAAVTLNGASASLVVGSVAKASPKSAATAAAAAVALQPKLAGAIITAAVKAAPGEAVAIVTESCKARPTSFYTIGVATAEAAPKASDKVVPAIIAGIPALKPVIARAQKDFKAANRTASLALLLKHSENLVSALSRQENISTDALLASSTDTLTVKVGSLADAPPAPVQLPPFVPGGNTPGEITPPGTPEVPPDRDYSTP